MDSISLQQSLKDLDEAYSNFFKRVKEGKGKVGFPKFKSKRNPKKSYRTQCVNNNIVIKDSKIKLPKLGLVKYANSKSFDGEIKSATISKSPTGKLYIPVLVETNIKSLPKNNNSIGIDLGLKDFAITSDGEIFSNPKFLKT